MIISIIAALAKNRVIGKDNKLPWKLPADMKWFREKTMGKPIVMGRKTFESFGAKPLPGRTNVIVTSNPDYQAPGCMICHSIKEALEALDEHEEVMIIGGASFYEQTLPRADRMYLTFIHHEFDGDAYFIPYNEDEWDICERVDRSPDEKNPYACSFVVLERKQPQSQH